MQEIESVYTFIWQWINQPARDQDHFEQILNLQNVRNVVLNEIWGLCQKHQIELMCNETDAEVIDECFQNLLKSKWIDEEGKIIVKHSNLTEESLRKLVPNEITDDSFQRIFFFLCDQKLRLKMIKIPNYFEDFVLLHLDSWIKSAIRALLMEDERQYIIDAAVSPSNRHADPSPIIIDLDTGADQLNSQWDEALHQFVQLKHGCKLSLQSLKSVFISNVSFFKMYQNMYGMSGTLGSPQEQENFKKIHHVDFITIPTFKPKQFTELAPLVEETHEKLFKKVCEQAKKTAEKRAVLMICETIKDVSEYFDELAKDSEVKVIALRRETDALGLNAKLGKLKAGQIIVATNLAGRGMNLKLEKEVVKAGGLHVLITNLPPNIRIEQQALGRAARSGSPGSGQICVNLEGSENSIFELKQERNKREIKRLEKVQKYYNNFIKVEESFFTTFNSKYQTIAESDEEKKVLKQSFLNNWSFWLDKNGQKIEEENQDELKNQLDEFVKLNTKDVDWSSSTINKTSKINFAIHDAEKPNTKILSQVSLIDENHNVVESYYKFYAENKKSSRNSSIENDKIFKSSHELRKIIRKFEDRKDSRLLREEMLKPLIERNKNKLMQLRGLSDQRVNNDHLDDIFIDSLHKILGQPVNPDNFEEVLAGKRNLCEELFVEMLIIGVLTPAKIRKNIPVEKCAYIAKKNFTSKEKLTEFVKSFEGKEIDIINFSDKIKRKISAPSREDFWKILVTNDKLKFELEFFTFNKAKLDEIDPSFLELLESDEMKSSRLKLKPSNNYEIFLYALKNEDADEIELTFSERTLRNYYNEAKFERLKQKGCLTLNKSARFQEKSKTFEFETFSELKIEDFKIVNIPEKAAKQILETLIDTKFIEKTPNESYKLKKTYEYFEFMNLGENAVYTNAVQNLFNHCFPYQIALQRMEVDVKKLEANVVIIQLPSNPHVNIFADFFNCGLIEQPKVDPSKSQKIQSFIEFSDVVTESEINTFKDKTIQTQKNNENLVDFLERENVIRKIAEEKYKINEFKVTKTSNSFFLNIATTIKLQLQNKKILSDKKEKIAEHVESLVSSWFDQTLEEPELFLKSIDEFADDLLRFGAEELHVIKNSGLTMVITVQEKKFTLAVTLRFIAVIFMGLVQILIGALIIFFSAGSLTLVGQAFISEGIGDIVFAITSFTSGHFTWADYGKHKAISLMITVATCGVGAYMARGKDIAGFGFKFAGNSLSIGGKSIAKMTGKELAKAIELKLIAKEVIKTVGKSISNAAVSAASSLTVDYLMEKELMSTIRSLSSELTVDVDEKLNQPELRSVLKSLYQILGRKKLLKVVEQIVVDEIKNKKQIREVENKIFKLIDAVRGALVSDKANNIVKWIRNALLAISLLRKADIFRSLGNYTGDIVESLKKDLDKEKLRHSDKKKVENKELWENVQLEILSAVKKPIDEDVTSIINDKIINPLLSAAAKKITYLSTKAARTTASHGIKQYQNYEYRKSSKTLKELNSGKQLNVVEITAKQKHEQKLMKLMKNTKDPKLMAALIKEDTQMNMIGVEASVLIIPDIVRALGNKTEKFIVKVEQENGDVYTFGQSGGVEINLKLKNNHFVNKVEGVKGNDCLFYALRDKIPELKPVSAKSFRTLLARRIERDPMIKYVIEMGWHLNTMGRGAFGGTLNTTDVNVNTFLLGKNAVITAGTYEELMSKMGGSKAGRKTALLEMNHSPPKYSYPGYKKGDKGLKLPAIAMLYEDHRELLSTHDKNYRIFIANLLNHGKWHEALQWEINDMQEVAHRNGKANYDIGLSQLVKIHQDLRNIDATQAAQLRNQFGLPPGYISPSGYVWL